MEPVRPMQTGALSSMVHTRFDQVGIESPQRGGHALRHACATYLINQGITLKEVGDHLGHRNYNSTRIYAKVNLAGLSEVANFDLGGLR